MSQWTCIKGRCGFNPFNTRLAYVVVFLKVVIKVDQVINVIAIGRYAPVYASQEYSLNVFAILVDKGY